MSYVLNQLVEKLKAADPYKIVLFGSYAKGTATPESDIDLMIILDNDYISKDYSEKLERNWEVKKLVLDINYQYPMDFKIYSKAEFKNLKNKGSFFIREIEKTGKTIYEKRN
jgi:predicted nucleotidyltransferase